MFIVRHRLYVDHPVAMNRAITSASLFLHEIGYNFRETTRTCGE